MNDSEKIILFGLQTVHVTVLASGETSMSMLLFSTVLRTQRVLFLGAIHCLGVLLAAVVPVYDYNSIM